jgi:acetyltransferase-like isoleucine patch superfamily enzyme
MSIRCVSCRLYVLAQLVGTLLPSSVRITLLRLMGNRIGHGCRIAPGSVLIARYLALAPYTTIEPFSLIYRPRLFTTGERARIASFVKILGFGRVTIADRVFIGNSNLIDCTTHFSVGSRSQLGPRGLYYTHGNTPLIFSKRFPNAFKPVVIGSDCEVAMGAIVYPGVSIGDGSYVFAGSVVSASLKPGTAYHIDRTTYKHSYTKSFRIIVSREDQIATLERTFVHFAAHHNARNIHRPPEGPWLIALSDGSEIIFLRTPTQPCPSPKPSRIIWRLEPGLTPQPREFVFETLTAHGPITPFVELVAAFLCNEAGIHFVIKPQP